MYLFVERKDKAGVRKLLNNRIGDAADREPSRDAVETQHPVVVKVIEVVPCAKEVADTSTAGSLP